MRYFFAKLANFYKLNSTISKLFCIFATDFHRREVSVASLQQCKGRSFPSMRGNEHDG